jgi:hypothetical protein
MQVEKIFKTSVGLLKGVVGEIVDCNGILLSCMLGKRNEISYQGEIYIPKYTEEDFRTRYRDAVKFYRDGALKSVYLEEPQEINTPVGKMNAELVTFYQSGHLHRVFLSYGQISAYWSEEEEAERLGMYEVNAYGQKLKARISCFQFYESGAIKSITLWPGESITVCTSAGSIRVRYEISFYESGSIQSVEPDRPVKITKDAIDYYAYDNQAVGIGNGSNSLSFYEDGRIKSLKSAVSAVIISDSNKEIRIAPEYRMSMTDMEKTEIIPIKVAFEEERLIITNSDGVLHHFLLTGSELKTELLLKNFLTLTEATKCSGCSGCNHFGKEKEEAL